MKRTLTIAMLVMLAGALLSYAAGGEWRLYALPAFLGFAFAGGIGLLRTPQQISVTDTEIEHRETPLLQTLGREVSDQQDVIDVRALGAKYRREQRVEAEDVVNGILDDCIALIRMRVESHTVAVFFPTVDGGYKVQRFFSRSEFVNKDAVIYPGVGVIGSFLKDGLKQLKLQEIVSDSKTLYYYTRDVGIRSLMASPVVTNGVERGTIIVDSTEPKHFTDEDHAYLSRIAAILSRAVYYTYLCNEYKLKHDRLVAMSGTEKEFFTHLDMDSILDRMVEIIPYAVSCDRLSISVRNDEEETGAILRVYGQHTGNLLNTTFPLNGKTLIPLLYSKNLSIFRNFSEQHYEPRYRDDEPVHREFRSFLAVPLGVDQCRGAILMESTRANAFSSSHRDLLARLATSAGLAIEKLQNLERAKALATHDGLTGLINHRQFQLLLTDQIRRAKRYNEPLSLVLCDIDHFKQINDNYGHPFGDVVLKGVADNLRESIRIGIDTAARYGGEEFALILVKTDAQHAVETADRIRQAIGAIPFREPRGEEVRVTMSFGIAVFGEHATTSANLIKRSDQALYRAKESGRNRVELF
ncbi:MAG: diguanylate cyclase [Chitinivibrionales bacterium]|nr:diguanylate cyclase [Chitinivibrionales bacterium]